MTVKTISILFLLLVGSFSETAEYEHALHLSTFEIIKKVKNSAAQLRLRVFQDDFRDAIKNANPDLASVANEAFLENRKAEIAQYFQQHFQLIIDDKNTTISLTDFSTENDIFWFHFDLTFPDKWQKCTLQADYLMELFDDQSNIGTVVLDGKKLFFRFTKKEVSFQISKLD